MVTPAFKRLPRGPKPERTGVEAERRLWLGLVSKFLERGDTMALAITSAARIVAFARGRDLPPEEYDTLRTGSGTFPKTEQPPQPETVRPPSSRFAAGDGRRK